MRKWLIIFIVLLALVAWVAYNPPEDSGYLLLSWGSKTLETSIWFAALVLVTLVVLLWFCWRLLVGSVRVARRVAGFVGLGGERAHKRTVSGLIDFIEGNWEQAYSKLLRSAHKVEVPLINYLAAARSAWELGRRDEAYRILQQTHDTLPDSELAVALTQARLELQDGHYDECLVTLLKVKPQAPQNPVLLDLLRQVYLARQDWDGIERIFDRLRNLNICTPDELRQLAIQLHRFRLSEAGGHALQLPQRERLACLQQAWSKLPGKLQKEAELVLAYAEQLARCSEDQEAELLLRKYLSRDWYPPMIPLYGRLRGADVRTQMRMIEDWLAQHPHDPQLLLALGRLSLRNQLWGKARDYFKESFQLDRSAEACAELARLLDALGESSQSNPYYQQVLDLALPALPDMPLPQKKAIS